MRDLVGYAVRKWRYTLIMCLGITENIIRIGAVRSQLMTFKLDGVPTLRGDTQCRINRCHFISDIHMILSCYSFIFIIS